MVRTYGTTFRHSSPRHIPYSKRGRHLGGQRSLTYYPDDHSSNASGTRTARYSPRSLSIETYPCATRIRSPDT